MNYNNEGPSNLLSSSSSSDDDNYAEIFAARQELIAQVISNNNQIILNYLNKENNQSRRRGSIPGHNVINRNREAADRNLFNDYFAENSLYNDAMFRRRFRMGRNLYMRIVDAVSNHDNYFTHIRDGLGRLGLSSLQKITAAFRILVYGVPSDATDEYIKIGESTAIQSVKRFCRAVVEVFGGQYLRSPNAHDVARLLQIGERRGFRGMLGSLDCMHWRWNNCPTAWAGQYSGRSGNPTIILEVVADYDLWIWHAHFGLPGSNNDINVLESSHLFANLAGGTAPPARYVIQGKDYSTGYYLADGIYPKWSTLVQTIHDPRGRKNKKFAMKQETCRKDVGKKNILHDIMTSCIIMHNMIIEDERDLNAPIVERCETPTPDVEPVLDDSTRFQEFLARYRQIKDKEAHIGLRNTLIEHLWEQYNNSES